MDGVMRKAVGWSYVKWKFTSNLDDLDYADDGVLISSTKQLIQDKTARMDAEATRLRSTINMEKTKVTRINAKEPGTDYDSRTRSNRSRWIHLGATVFKEGGGVKDLKKQNLKASIKGKESEK